MVSGERRSGTTCAIASEYSAIMVDRWLKCHEQLPQVDKRDMSVESSFLNGGEVLTQYSQDNPEMTQQAYLRIRALEESYLTFDYMSQKSNPGFRLYVLETEKGRDEKKCENGEEFGTSNYIVSQFDRSYGIQKIFDLHYRKEYRIETLFIATSIFDRYLATVGHWNFPREHICRLSTASLLIAAKLE